jgi:O-antigen/teichoic acid export membrane protein
MAITVNSNSIVWRFFYSLLTNLAKNFIGLFTAIYLARDFGPEYFGEYGYLLATLTALSYLIDLGGANALNSGVAKKKRGIKFYYFYFFWVLLSITIALFVINFILSESIVFDFLNQKNKLLISVATISIFLQVIVVNTLSNILESVRKSIISQNILLLGSFIFIGCILTIDYFYGLTLEIIFYIMLIQQLTISLIFLRFCYSYVFKFSLKIDENWKENSVFFWRYTSPLFPSIIVVFLYTFLDRYMLQKFSGSIQQGFFQIANQISLIPMIFVASSLKIFTKEIAESFEKSNFIRMQKIYDNTFFSILFFLSIIAGLLSAWSNEILTIILGSDYSDAWVVFMILLLSPIYQGLGQVTGSFLLAIGDTRLQSKVTIITIFLSFPLLFILLAPKSSFGLELGASGLAFKLLIINYVSVCIIDFIISKKYKMLYKNKYIFIVISLLLLGFFLKFITTLFFTIDPNSIWSVFKAFIFYIIVYILFILLGLYLMIKNNIFEKSIIINLLDKNDFLKKTFNFLY